jgi:sporulation protein YabP
MVEDKKINSIGVIQNIFLENREKLNISGVKDVLSFDDQMVIVETELGMLTIKGDNLRINKLSLDTSEVSIDGLVNNIIYSDNIKDGGKKSGSLLGKIFK